MSKKLIIDGDYNLPDKIINFWEELIEAKSNSG